MKNIKLLITILALSFFLFFFSARTYSSLSSTTSGNTSAELAKWNILINNTNISSTYTETVSVNNIDWESDHAINYNAAPGSTGVIHLTIDPTDTQVAIRFDLTVIDHTVDETKLLTIESMTLDGKELVQTAPNTYTGVFTLDDIEAHQTSEITIEATWVNDEANNENDSKIAQGELEPDYLGLDFKAIQYHGEEIVPYIP